MKLRRMLLFGIGVRLAIAPFTAHPFDVYNWFAVGKDVVSGRVELASLFVPYNYSYFLFVIPAAYSYWAISSLGFDWSFPISSLDPRLSPGPQWEITMVPGIIFNTIVKIPLIISDAMIGVLIYKMVLAGKGDRRHAQLATALWLFNPLSVWITAGWGMFDTLPTLFVVLCMFCIMRGDYLSAGASLTLAIAMKYYAVVLALPLLLVAWNLGGRRGLTRASVGFGASILVLFGPSIREVASGFYYFAVAPLNHPGYYAGPTFWTAITLFENAPQVLAISSLLVVVSLGVTYFWIFRAKVRDIDDLVVIFAVPVAILLVFYRAVNENYFVWILPMIAVLSVKRPTQWVGLAFSVSGLIFSVTESLLPFYLLPVAPWIGDSLIAMLSFAEPYRIAPGGTPIGGITTGKVLLASLAVTCTVTLLITAHQWFLDTRSASRGGELSE